MGLSASARSARARALPLPPSLGCQSNYDCRAKAWHHFFLFHQKLVKVVQVFLRQACLVPEDRKMQPDPDLGNQGPADRLPENTQPTISPVVDTVRMASVVTNTLSEVEILKQRLNEQSQLMMQMVSVLRPPAYVPMAQPSAVSEQQTSAQVLAMLQGGGFKFSPGDADSVAYPRTIEEWERKIRPLIGKKLWTLGDMITATLGYMHCRGVGDMGVAHMVVSKIREMGAAEYKPVFEEMANSSDPVAYWEGLAVNTGPRITRVVSGHPFSTPRSFSSGGDTVPKTVPTKKEKK